MSASTSWNKKMSTEGTAKRQRVLKRPRNRLTVATVLAALRQAAGIQSVAAEMLKVNRSTVCKFIKKNPKLAEALDDITEELLDLSEAKLLAGIRGGEFPFIKLYLEAKGRGRGYGRSVMVSGPGGGPIQVRQDEYDLSNLTLEELKDLEAKLAKCAVDATPAAT